MDAEQELNKLEREISQAEREVSQSMGELKVHEATLKKLGVTFKKAPDKINELKGRLEKIDLLIEAEMKDLKDNYEW